MRQALTLVRAPSGRKRHWTSWRGLIWSLSAFGAPTLVRHAGGEIRGVRYSNSIEAIQSSIALQASLIEIDLVPSREGRWYCLHDYEEVWPSNAGRVRLDRWLQRWFAKAPAWAYPAAVDLESHLAAQDARSGLRHCQLEDLARIANSQHGRLAFITDTKYDNLLLLATLALLDKRHFVPQVYNLAEYLEARRLGFPRIIYTLYKHGDYEPLRNILRDPMLWKIVLPETWLCKGAKARPPTWLNDFTREILVHTVNDPREVCRGPVRVDGYYTDTLAPVPAPPAPQKDDH